MQTVPFTLVQHNFCVRTVGPPDFHDAENTDKIAEYDNKNAINCKTRNSVESVWVQFKNIRASISSQRLSPNNCKKKQAALFRCHLREHCLCLLLSVLVFHRGRGSASPHTHSHVEEAVCAPITQSAFKKTCRLFVFSFQLLGGV